METLLTLPVHPLRADLAELVRQQLPPDLQNRLAIAVEGDAYRLSCSVTFRAEDGRKWVYKLGHGELGGWVMACRLPDAAIAELCVSV